MGRLVLSTDTKPEPKKPVTFADLEIGDLFHGDLAFLRHKVLMKTNSASYVILIPDGEEWPAGSVHMGRGFGIETRAVTPLSGVLTITED